METYYELTIKHDDGTQEKIRGDKGFSIEHVVEDIGVYNPFDHTICQLDLPATYRIMYFKGNTRYEVTHHGDFTYGGFKADIWWVEFLTGDDKWEKASGYSDKLSFALDDLNELEATTDGFVYRINGGILGEKESLWSK